MLTDYISRTVIKIISNLNLVRFEISDTLTQNEFIELENYPVSHYKLIAGFVKTLNPLVVISFSGNYNPLNETALKKYLYPEGKLVNFLNESEYVCSDILSGNDKRVVNIKSDFNSKEKFDKYDDILKYGDLFFCDDTVPERVSVLLEKLKLLKFERNPLLLLNNINEKEIKGIKENLGLPSMNLSSFSSDAGIAVIDIKNQKNRPCELQQESRSRKLHIGCGYQKISGFINVDVRPTDATDLVHNCVEFDDFEENSFDIIYSHAFFEHLNVSDELKCLKNIKRIISSDGKVIFLGIPDFEIIAQKYTEDSLKKTGNKFDLMQVYRYTHGAPEQGGDDWWFEQLHKSVFDKEMILNLLRYSGYKHFVIFRYYFRDEKIPLNLGFIASMENLNLNDSGKIFDEIKKIMQEVQNSDIEILNYE